MIIPYKHYFHPKHEKETPLGHRPLVSIGSIPTLIVCIDGHRPYNDFFEFSFFHLSFKVIRMQLFVSQETCEKYAEALKTLYGAKFIVEKSYQKLIKRTK